MKRCECNYHLGMGPNLKCPLHGEANFKSLTAPRQTGGLMSERENEVYAHLLKARIIASNAADNEVVDIIDAVIAFMDGRNESKLKEDL